MSSDPKEQLAGLVEEMSDELEMASYLAVTRLPTESLRDWHKRLSAILATLPEPGVVSRDREADRTRFTDKAFNDWLDTGISDAGHTVWDAVGDTQAAWKGWEARQFAGDAVLLTRCCGREECGGECGNDWLGMDMYRKPDAYLAPAAPAGEVVTDEAHCATCTCVPGMTPAVRFDASPAEREGAVREHLISMGWTPPGEDAPPAQGFDAEVVGWRVMFATSQHHGFKWEVYDPEGSGGGVREDEVRWPVAALLDALAAAAKGVE
ncbi:hypothetical protein LY625_03930 [Lysobacter sp. GX 14042]|uniref:hypothetical protein n=1 Tax=Lysobacter sp. GX 14042 TaxID=2907155 RepID=UPI001F2F8047|nr:hypothetical protein [Lysobacter sp. GX 14042]MCE7031772.1 hypothetical protein [Lysobacter sp. GX 14042]